MGQESTAAEAETQHGAGGGGPMKSQGGPPTRLPLPSSTSPGQVPLTHHPLETHGLASTADFLFCFSGLHLQLMAIPRLGVELELQLPSYATTTATRDPSPICDLHHSLWQCGIPNPLSKARDRTCILTDTMSDA